MPIPPLNPRDNQPVSHIKRVQVPGDVPRDSGVEAIEYAYASQRAKALKVVKELEVELDRPNMHEWVKHLDDKPTMDEVIDGLANLLALDEMTP